MQKIFEKILFFEKETLNKFNKSDFFEREEYKNFDKIVFKNFGITGLRGIGKTSYLLNKRKKTENSLYLSTDWGFLSGVDFLELIIYIYKNYNITTFFIDEIQFLKNWDNILKNIFDTFYINIIFSGSSKVTIEKLGTDLSRRVIIKKLFPFYYGEYISFKYSKKISFSFEELIQNHKNLSLKYYEFYEKQTNKNEFLNFGEFGYFYEGIKNEDFYYLLNNSIKKSIYEDVPQIANLQTTNLVKIENLLNFIVNMGASNISINKLSQKIGLDNKITLLYLQYLEKIGWISLIEKYGNLSTKIRKDKKIYLNSNNLSNYLSTSENSNFLGKIRETFFITNILRILKEKDFIQFKSQTDFVVTINGKEFYFEIGGKNKKQNNYPKNTFIVKDSINISENENIIPLWLFGFLTKD